MLYFFFQAEDGIRVTSVLEFRRVLFRSLGRWKPVDHFANEKARVAQGDFFFGGVMDPRIGLLFGFALETLFQIGRASCRKECRYRWSQETYKKKGARDTVNYERVILRRS